MAFSLPFFRKKTDKPTPKIPSDNVQNLSNISNNATSSVAVQLSASAHNNISACVLPGNCDLNDCDTLKDGASHYRGLIRLDSGVDMKLGDLGVTASDSSNRSASSPSNSSQLSKSLDEILRDKDALAYFISYLKARDADGLIKFWLAVEAFRISAIDRTMLSHANDLDHRLPSSAAVAGEISTTDTAFYTASSLPKNSIYSLPPATSTASAPNVPNDHEIPDSSADRNRSQPTGTINPISLDLSFSDSAVAGHPRVTSYDCGHLGAVGDSPKFGGRVPAHGEIPGAARNSTDEGRAVGKSESVVDRAADRTVVDHCSASDPYPVTSDVVEDTGRKLRDSDDYDTPTEDLSPESIQKGIERDAVAIFSRYLSPDCPHPVHVPERLREGAVHQICREDGRGIDPDCFTACQRFVFDVLQREHFSGFQQSVYHCKHQIDVLTGSQISLNDVLYDDTAFSYFTEFMESERVTELLQCFLDLDNFHQLLSCITPQTDSQTSAARGTPHTDSRTYQRTHSDPMSTSCSSSSALTQDDAIVIYDKYFSLQATRRVRFDDVVRQEVESKICRDDGPAADCFGTPRHIVSCHLERTYLPLFLNSELYFKYLSDLINTVQLAQDTIVFPRRRRGSESNSERSAGSAGNDSVSARNTLLAMDTRGQHIKRAVNKIGDDLRIDSSLLDPEALWKRPAPGAMRLGRVDQLGQFISEFDPEPDRDRKGIGALFARKSEKVRLDEEMALQVAQMIINDVTSTTSGGHDLDDL